MGWHLGISAFYHDSAAALVRDGEIIAAAQEERFTRVKHDPAFPSNAVQYCLREGGIALEDCQSVTFYDKPFLKFERLLETYVSFAPRGFRSFAMAIPVWIREKMFLKSLLRDELKAVANGKEFFGKLHFTEHHLSHAASAFYPSPFENAAILVMDGVGEWATTSVWKGMGRDIQPVSEIHFPHSLGLLYSAFTFYTGFKVNSGEYKLMGLAPYGEPKYVDLIKQNIVAIHDDGSFHLDLTYFDYCTGLKMINSKFERLFGKLRRKPEELLEQFHMDVAASIQKVAEEMVIKLAQFARRETGLTNLCLAGGVALNCVANGVLLREKIFDDIWIQPASGDAGGALGAALADCYLSEEVQRTVASGGDGMKGSYLGSGLVEQEVDEMLRKAGAVYHKLSWDELVEAAAMCLANEEAVGWCQGRMEFGPRALGARSIIGDARSPKMQSVLNLKIKYRESFRPFAPAVLAEDVGEWFDHDKPSPYMLIVAEVLDKHRRKTTEEEEQLFGIEKLNVPRSTVPAITHVDYSARVQTVHRETNPLFHKLIARFKEITGCPMVVNTSFNVRGEPLVCTAEDAFKCFMGTEMDSLFCGPFWLKKSEQNPELKKQYHKELLPD